MFGVREKSPLQGVLNGVEICRIHKNESARRRKNLRKALPAVFPVNVQIRSFDTVEVIAAFLRALSAAGHFTHSHRGKFYVCFKAGPLPANSRM